MNTRSEWLVGMLTRKMDDRLKRVLFDLFPFIGTDEVALVTVDEARERLRSAEGAHTMLLIGPFPPRDTAP